MDISPESVTAIAIQKATLLPPPISPSLMDAIRRKVLLEEMSQHCDKALIGRNTLSTVPSISQGKTFSALTKVGSAANPFAYMQSTVD
jgi:hypothetical protein